MKTDATWPPPPPAIESRLILPFFFCVFFILSFKTNHFLHSPDSIPFISKFKVTSSSSCCYRHLDKLDTLDTLDTQTMAKQFGVGHRWV